MNSPDGELGFTGIAIGDINRLYLPPLSPKWISDDGTEMYLIFSDAANGHSTYYNSSAEACQPWWITIHVPKDAAPGMRWHVKVDHKTDGGAEGGDYSGTSEP